MVDGQLTNVTEKAENPPSKVVVVDLDGTLIDGNSLRVYVCLGMRQLIHHNPIQAGVLAAIFVLRKLRIVSHRRMKFAALKRIRPDSELRQKFTAKIDAMRRPEVARLIERYRKDGAEILLATAAADVYIPWIWTGPYVATPTRENPGRIECRGTLKARAVARYIGLEKALEAVVTDHVDDLALLNSGARTNYLVAPDARTYSAVRLAGIPFELLGVNKQ